MSENKEEPLSAGYIIETNFFNFLVKAEEFLSFCGNWKWWVFDIVTMCQYMVESPYKIMKRLYGEDRNFVYGEVPVMTVCRMLRDIDACHEDVFFDLGSGRGHGVFAAYFSDISKSVGIELTEAFVKNASSAAKMMKAGDRVKFICGDFTEADLNEGTIFFIAGTTMDDDVISLVAERICSIPHPLKVLSISQRLPGKCFKNVFSKKYRFSWGEATVFYQVKC